ncbi:hypothetical protein D3C84_979280 [compost metagenome]
MPGQGCERHALPRGQWVATVYGQHQWVVAQQQAGQTRVFNQQRGGGKVDAVIFQRFDHLL